MKLDGMNDILNNLWAGKRLDGSSLLYRVMNSALGHFRLILRLYHSFTTNSGCCARRRSC